MVVDTLRFFMLCMGKSLYLACVVFTLMQKGILPFDFVNYFSVRLDLSNVLYRKLFWMILMSTLLNWGLKKKSPVPYFLLVLC